MYISNKSGGVDVLVLLLYVYKLRFVGVNVYILQWNILQSVKTFKLMFNIYTHTQNIHRTTLLAFHLSFKCTYILKLFFNCLLLYGFWASKKMNIKKFFLFTSKLILDTQREVCYLFKLLHDLILSSTHYKIAVTC